MTAETRREAVGKAFRKTNTNLSDGCFADMAVSLHSTDKKLFADSLVAIFSSRSGKGKFSQELFFALYRMDPVVRNKQLWKKIVDIWEGASEQPVYAVLASHSDGGKIPIADTLYRALDAAGRVDAHDLLRYGRVKCLLGDYRAAAGIYCRVIASDGRVEHAAVTQMGQFFADADSSDKAAALAAFEDCVFELPEIDTAFYRNWLADFYGRHGLYEREVGILVSHDRNAPPGHGEHAASGRKLAAAAKGHLSSRRYRPAATAAAAAHSRLEKADQIANASIAYQAYAQLGIKDSALMWLRISEARGNDVRIRIAALSQETGGVREAGALIDSLPASLSKDTLIVRQYLFSGEIGAALNHIASRQMTWRMHPVERMFWQARALIFNGLPHDAAPALDSIKIAPMWHGASEVLRYKYWIQKLEDDRQALDTWGRLEFLIYIGDLTSAAQFLKKNKPAGEPGEMLAVLLARRLAAASRFREGLEILEPAEDGGKGSGGIPDYGIKGIPGRDDRPNDTVPGRTPEYLYFKAEVLNALGRQEESRALAKRILKDFPGDIFAQRARILLTKI